MKDGSITGMLETQPDIWCHTYNNFKSALARFIFLPKTATYSHNSEIERNSTAVNLKGGLQLNALFVLYVDAFPWKFSSSKRHSILKINDSSWSSWNNEFFWEFLVIIRIFVINKSLKGKC